MRILAAILTALSTTLASASSTTTDYSDIWLTPSEPGWGINIVHQANTLFATIFVYGSNNQPTWFVASDVRQATNSEVFGGTLYSLTGSYYGAPFSGATLSTVGTLTFSATGESTANLSYTVNGVTVNKAIARSTFKGENIAGSYIGGSMGTWAGCGPTRNGYVEASAAYTVSHDTNNSVQIREEGNNFQCSYTGNYVQNGRFGTITGGGLCSDGVNQTFAATEVTVSRQAFTMKFNVGQGGGCNFTGRMGGMRRGP